VTAENLLPHVLEVLAPRGVEVPRLFGSHGLYHEGRLFGLVSDRHLYFHTGSHNGAIKASPAGRS
jgi:TfoX/Sxy family transcriptional regulator of competence genes